MASGCVISDLLEFQGISYPSTFECFRRKRTFSTVTGDYTHGPRGGFWLPNVRSFLATESCVIWRVVAFKRPAAVRLPLAVEIVKGEQDPTVNKGLVIGLLSLLFATPTWSQQLNIPVISPEDDVQLARKLPDLAERAIAIYSDADRDRYLRNLFRLQMVAGQYAEAQSTLDSIRASYAAVPSHSAADLAPDEITVRAAPLIAGGSSPQETLQSSFR